MKFNSAQSVRAHLAARPVRHLVDGTLCDSVNHFSVIDPATGLECAESPSAPKELLDTAVEAAGRAQPAWARCTIDERRSRLAALAMAMRDQADELAALITLEQGKPLAQAKNEVARSAALVDGLISTPLPDEVLRSDATGRVMLSHRPLGVVGAIAPWNVPLALAVPKIAHALYTGNTIVLKPSPYTPLSTLRLGEIAQKLFPAAVLNVLAGGNELGQWICEHPGIAKISFTGSVGTGKRVMQSAAASLKRLTLELGGNDAAIVLEDADVDAIAPQLFAAAFNNSGQICMAIKRLFVHESLHDRLAEALASLAREVRLGGGFEPDVQMGPVQNKAQFNSVMGVLADCRGRAEARILSGGHALDRPGYFIAPTVVTGLREGAMLIDEETFGPVLPVLSFANEEEAVARANLGELGLGASVWTPDIRRAESCARQLVAGTVWVNRHVGVDPEVPFGGARQSGIGSQFGLAGLHEHMQAIAIVSPQAADLH